ncbi:hypothetical protein H4W23_21430 [Streptomyces gardneri]|uniref:hypothetical protein n=1 Tax=Streptomyces gardneri TaxID=66892 RepID=UPI0012666556|nr:hypothetical protein [Streptomyces gardneri]QPK46925.1 hypothetical protein H4W23_21430 [Streptomyces gardneri]WRK38334.1 hypothetical protein U0M97_21530 [Streptomyces venezuelae]
MTDVRRRAPAVLVLLALLALLMSICHGAHGHVLPSSGGATVSATATATAMAATAATTTVSAPALPHGCERSGEVWSFDVHLPAQTAASQLAAPEAGEAVTPSSYAADLRTDPRARCVRGRAGPGPEPGRLLIALGVDRN